jgi:hypothetical protein
VRAQAADSNASKETRGVALAVKRRGARRKSRRRKSGPLWRAWVPTGVEIGALLTAALVAVIASLGFFADWFAGLGWSHLLPFAGAVLGLVLACALLLRGWLNVRLWLARRARLFPATLAVIGAGAAVWFATRPTFTHEVTSLRTLVGGAAEAERAAIGHQVYAAYRRADLEQTVRVLERARVFEPTIQEAAAAFAMDPEVLMGIGAAESAFYPRDSADGGRGLFQITAPPRLAVAQARKQLRVSQLDPLNQRHNAFVAAATLRHYLAAMHGDLFLALLAYNIGPRNGGLASIMKQYGARDFVSIQPYLQHLPGDYPIRVLSAALAYRLWRTQGRLPRYQDGDNALRIQAVGIPGLQPAPPRLAAARG